MCNMNIKNFTKSLFRSTSKSLVICIRNYTPRRALLYVPGDDMKKVQKALTLDVDCIALDCEDGVAVNKKVDAARNIRDLLEKGKPTKQRKYDLAVRVNAASSGILKDDMKVILSAKHSPDTILLPKVDHADELKLFSDYLNESKQQVNTKVGLIIMIETAISLMNVGNICKTAKEMSQVSKFAPQALLFGSDDFCASIGARRTESSSELLYARQKIVTTAKAFELQAIDMVYIDYKNAEGLKKQAREGAQFGYTGKQVIHPDQIPITQEAFLPSEKEIKWATGVVDAFYKRQKEGEGAFAYEGAMIDLPTVRQAQNIIDLMTTLNMYNKESIPK